MSEALFTVMWLIYAFWLGHEVGLRRERKNAANLVGLAKCIIEQARVVKSSSRFTGEGPQITTSTSWAIHDLGKFKVTVEEEIA